MRNGFKSISFNWVVWLFVQVGVLPFFLLTSLFVFTIFSDYFFSVQNFINVARQSVYLVLVSLGQMLVLITGGFDLSVGTTIALTSVVLATVMVGLTVVMPDAGWIIIILGILVGIGVAALVGALNGIGVAKFNVSPFIMTLGVQSIGAGVGLFITGGVPVSGLPYAFGNVFGFGRIAGIPTPVLITLIVIAVLWVIMNRTILGAHIYAVGGNIRAAQLSGVDTKRILFFAYIVCALLASLAGVLLTARVESGETNLGGTIALESIAACVIAGVSLRGGIGRVENVVLGAFFIVLVQNGMNLMTIGSYMQMVLLGGLLILAVIFDQYRYYLMISQQKQ